MVHRRDNMNIDDQYLAIAKSILENGSEKNDRTGTGTKSIFSAQVVHNMSEGFPLLTTKKVYWKGIVSELLWFLRGDTNIKWLVENDNNIWVGDAWKHYLKENKDLGANEETASKEWFIKKIKKDDYFASEWGELGPIYGAQWRNWKIEEDTSYEGKYVWIDQIQQAIHTLKTNPDSRRIIVSAWNVGELDNMVLPPCHYGFQVYTRELSFEERHMIWHDEGKKANVSPYMESQLSDMLDRENVPTRAISLKWHQRSVDLPLGLPFNIASYALLLEILAKEVNMVPGTLVGDLTNVHIYKNQIEGMMEQIERDPYEYDYPKLVIANNTTWGNGIDEMLGSVLISDFQVEGYESYPSIKMPLSN
jgi:thymidylate synthase